MRREIVAAAMIVLVLGLVAASPLLAQQAEFVPGAYELRAAPALASTPPASEPSPGTDVFPGNDSIYYDDGTNAAYWYYTGIWQPSGLCVRFTPRAYPCEVVGAVGRMAYYLSYANLYFRMLNSARALVFEAPITPPPLSAGIDYTYNFATPQVVTSGDFYLGLHQTAANNMALGSDAVTNYADRSWFYYTYIGTTWQQLNASGGYGDFNLRAIVRYHDVGASEISFPADGQMVVGGSIVPTVKVKNYAPNLDENTPFDVKFSIRDIYGNELRSQTKQITLTAGEVQTVTFDEISPPLPYGSYVAVCSTALGLDCRLGNNKVTARFAYVAAPSPDLVIEKVDGVLPASLAADDKPVFTVLVRNRGNVAYPSGGTIRIRVAETRPMHYPGGALEQDFITGSIPVGGTASFTLDPYTVLNSRPGPIEYTFSIVNTSTSEPTYNNQTSILIHYYDAASVVKIHINENFNSGLANWDVSGQVPRWDTTVAYPPAGTYPLSPPTAPIRLSESYYVTDSKSGEYANNSWITLTYKWPFDLVGAISPMFLCFSDKYSFGTGADSGRVELSTDGGTTWVPILTRTGQNANWPNWDTTRVDLSAYQGKEDIRLRFRLRSDASGTGDGWYIDDVIVACGSYPPPIPPYPEAPEKGAKLYTRTPTLRVEAATQAQKYEFRVFERAGGLLAQGQSTTRTWTVDPPLPAGTTYDWDCRYLHPVAGWSEYFSPAWWFQIDLPPDPPILKYPANLQEINSLPLVLRVGRMAGVASYEWKVMLLNGTQVATGTSTDSFWQVPDGALNNGQYYKWTCRVRSKLGTYSEWASEWYFSVFLRPDPPVPSSPDNGSEVASKIPALRVNAVPGATEYEFRVFDLETGNRKTSGKSTSNIWSVPLRDSLTNGKWYEWDCRLKMGGVWSNYYTPRWSFRVAIRPSTPILESPTNGSTVTFFQPTLRVKVTPYAQEYEFKVYTYPEGIYVTGGTTANNYWEVDVPLTNGAQYQWECRARNLAGYSNWSERWNFRVAVVASVPVPLLPENNAELNTFTPSLHVAKVADAILYEFKVYKADSLISKYSTQTADTFWNMGTALVNGQAYDWHCRAKNLAGWGNYFSPKWRFTIKVPPAAPELESPANEATGQAIAGILKWKAADLATGYDVYLDTKNPPEELVSANQSGLTYSYSELEYDRYYYWKVVARNAGGTASSGVWRFRTQGAPPRDAGVERIVSPLGMRDTSTAVKPVAVFRNYWNESSTFWAFARLLGPDGEEYYRDSVKLTLAAETSTQYEFAAYNLGRAAGSWKVVCSTFVANDQDHANDRLEETFSVVARPPWKKGFEEAAPMPGTAGVDKPPKDGAWIVTGPDRFGGPPVIYVAKGNKTGDFFKYYPLQDSWVKIPTGIPGVEDGKIKPPAKGTRATVATRDGAIYMTRGNNMLGFWRYDIDADTWIRKQDVPMKADKKKVKGGNDLAYVWYKDTNWIYLLKGGKTEFYRYNVEKERWDTLPDVPYTGTANNKFDKGSFLVYDGSRYLYAHRAKFNDGVKSHFMYRYDVERDSWRQTPLRGMPLYNLEAGKLKKKKSGDGAGGVWFNGHIYALKGGGTQGFFRYEVAYDTWTPLDTVPRNGSGGKKTVKAGGGITYYDYGAFFVMKGNKSFELWRYVEPPSFFRSVEQPTGGVMTAARADQNWLQVSPNPLSSGFARLRYSVPLPGPVTVSLYDVAGRVAYRQSLLAARSGVVNLDLRKLATGVYLVRLDASGFSATQKLVLQK